MLKSQSPIRLCGLTASREYLNFLKLNYLNTTKQSYLHLRPPTLHIIKATKREDSSIYIRNKMKILNGIGFQSILHVVDLSTNKISDIVSLIHSLNHNPDCHGILLQSPVDGHDASYLFSEICPLKDVDGLHPTNTGKLSYYYNSDNSDSNTSVAPCTPIGIIHLLNYYLNDSFKGKHVVIVGSSLIVGRPLSQLLVSLGSTVTISNSKTPKNLLSSLIENADILISATGSPHLIASDQVKVGSILIDVGISRDSNGSIKGDILYKKISHLKAFSTVPGGVGPMTTAMMAGNLFKLWKNKL